MKVIIIDDDQEILSFLEKSLTQDGFMVDCAKRGDEGLELIKNNGYDLIILDLSLPDTSGDEICKIIRQEKKTTPVMILSANYKVESKIRLLNLGADDYLIKPFSLDELKSRIRALLRRPNNIISPIIKIGNIEIDKQKQTVVKSGKEIYLTRKEFLILEYLMSYPDIIISRNELMEHVWSANTNFFSKTIEMHMVNLRKKIDSDKKGQILKTISGRGYKFNK